MNILVSLTSSSLKEIMPNDITAEFKACVKASKLGSSAALISTSTANVRKASALQEKSSFELQARKLVADIKALKTFLIKNRRSYLNSAWHADVDLFSFPGANGMSDADRDEIDALTQKLVKNCSDAVKHFRPESVRSSTNLQTRQHREVVVHLIDEYLKAVITIYSEQVRPFIVVLNFTATIVLMSMRRPCTMDTMVKESPNELWEILVSMDYGLSLTSCFRMLRWFFSFEVTG